MLRITFSFDYLENINEECTIIINLNLNCIYLYLDGGFTKVCQNKMQDDAEKFLTKERKSLLRHSKKKKIVEYTDTIIDVNSLNDQKQVIAQLAPRICAG